MNQTFEGLLETLHHEMPCKDSLTEHDHAVVLQEIDSDTEKIQFMIFYVYVQSIERDMSKKDEWWHVKFVCIDGCPPTVGSWILRTPQMNGQEVFTMGGKQIIFQPVDLDSYNGKVPPAPEEKVKRHKAHLTVV